MREAPYCCDPHRASVEFCGDKLNMVTALIRYTEIISAHLPAFYTKQWGAPAATAGRGRCCPSLCMYVVCSLLGLGWQLGWCYESLMSFPSASPVISLVDL